MVILPARDTNTGGFAGRRIAPLGGDEQRRGEDFAVSQRNRHAMLAAINRDGGRLPVERDQLGCLGAGAKRLAEVAILVHPAERLVVASGRLERQRAGGEPVGDADRTDRTAGLEQERREADRIEHPP